jgi:hypothetical protein
MRSQVSVKRRLMEKQNKCLILSLFVLSSLVLSSQTIEKCYVGMPDVLNPVMGKKNRIELIEYHKAGQSDSVENKFGNQAYLQVYDTLNDRIVVRNTTNSTFEMRVFKQESVKPFIGCINTICAPICQSSIVLYDTAWNKISLRFIMPKAIEWLNEEELGRSGLDKVWVWNVLENSFVSLTFDSVSSRIIAKNNSVEFLNDNDKKLLITVLNDATLVYDLIGRNWTRR